MFAPRTSGVKARPRLPGAFPTSWETKMVQSVRCVKCAAVRRAQPPALAQMITASATRARRSSKAFNWARRRAGMLAAAAQALFKYKRGAARLSVRAVAKQHGVPRSTLSDSIKGGVGLLQGGDRQL
ncbi:hypothetical protein HaLaN_31716 [Haematococcus lacustris]|uniref:Uncharacterized protein n=1 Tax=Haematococcus lacustris TaxID=44745 RepID=A0A6A0AIQ3_HAELA|nr:hypothetical protein HaLaN_31716 [Haematococcus lacustris]